MAGCEGEVILGPEGRDALLCTVCLSNCSSQQQRQVHSFLMLRDLIFLICIWLCKCIVTAFQRYPDWATAILNREKWNRNWFEELPAQRGGKIYKWPVGWYSVLKGMWLPNMPIVILPQHHSKRAQQWLRPQNHFWSRDQHSGWLMDCWEHYILKISYHSWKPTCYSNKIWVKWMQLRGAGSLKENSVLLTGGINVHQPSMRAPTAGRSWYTEDQGWRL